MSENSIPTRVAVLEERLDNLVKLHEEMSARLLHIERTINRAVAIGVAVMAITEIVIKVVWK